MSGGSAPQYDVVIIGAGVSGNLIAKQLGLAGKKVFLLEAGLAVPDSREQYMENFYLALAKTPEAPYPALAGRTGSSDHPVGVLPDPSVLPTPRATVLGLDKAPDVSYLVQAQSDASLHPKKKDPQNPKPEPDHSVRGLQFSSTYERIGGGTSWHWLGTSLRELENDIRLKTKYDHGVDWPVTYEELQPLWAEAEKEIGVAASTVQQEPLEVVGLEYPPGYQYPMGPIPTSLVDQAISQGIAGLQVPGTLPNTPGGSDPTMYDVFVTPTPAGRNSEPYDDRRVCAGNTNCIPICPIQAKWDPTVTLGKALDTGNVKVSYQSVAYNVAVEGKPDDGQTATRVDYYKWSRDAAGKMSKVSKSVTAKVYVLACHAIENAKLLLLSNDQKGIANRSDQVGRNLMDHPLYLTWALAPEPIWGYRGPLATAGIESLRDGEFRKYRASFRMEIGNEGWNFSKGDPYTTTMDFIQGTNNADTNKKNERMGGLKLAEKLNNLFTRQFRIACMFDQSPLQENRVTLDVDPDTGKPNHVDGLGLPRPKVDYGFDPYTMEGFRMADYVCKQIYERMGAEPFTKNSVGGTGDFTYCGEDYHYYGAGHVVGTHRMGTDPNKSVVDASQRSHDVQNLWVVGSGSFPTVCTANPTLTLLALAFKSAESILGAL